VIIKLPNESFYINFDKDGNYTLYETKVTQSGKNTGTRYESVIGYYGSLSSAVKRYISRQLGESKETVTIEQFLEVYEKLVDEVTAYLTPKGVNV
jgi:hypothetical protein